MDYRQSKKNFECGVRLQEGKVTFYGLLIVAIVVTLLVAEIAPSAANAFLLLLILGMVLSNVDAFRELVSAVTTVSKTERR